MTTRSTTPAPLDLAEQAEALSQRLTLERSGDASVMLARSLADIGAELRGWRGKAGPGPTAEEKADAMGRLFGLCRAGYQLLTTPKETT